VIDSSNNYFSICDARGLISHLLRHPLRESRGVEKGDEGVIRAFHCVTITSLSLARHMLYIPSNNSYTVFTENLLDTDPEREPHLFKHTYQMIEKKMSIIFN